MSVVYLNVITRLPIPVERVMAKATEADLDEVIVMGFTKDGDFYFAASEPDGPSVLWLLELAKKNLLAIGDGE